MYFGLKCCQYCLIRSVPLTVIKSSSSCSLSFWSRNLFRVEVPVQDSHRCMMHLLLSGLCMPSPSPLPRLSTQHFDGRYKRKESSHLWASQNTPFGWQGTFRCFSLKAVYNNCKLQRLLQVAKFLIMSPLLTLTKSFFSGTYSLNLSSSETFVTRWRVFQWW